MTDAAEVTLTTRQQVREATPEEFAKANSKAVLISMAEEAGIKEEAIAEAKTKADITALIYAKFPPPDPSLRGKSTIDQPVAAMWSLLNEDLIKNGVEGRLRRKDGVAAGQAVGVAYFTARTQYQAWFVATDKGTKPFTEATDGIPQALKPKAEPEAAEK